MRCQKQFENMNHEKNVEHAISRLNLLRTSDAAAFQTSKSNNGSAYDDTPLIYDTGASYGLTPFRGDFIDYQPCDIPIRDISKVN